MFSNFVIPMFEMQIVYKILIRPKTATCTVNMYIIFVFLRKNGKM